MAVLRVYWDPNRKVFIPHGRSIRDCENLEGGSPYNMVLEGDWSAESMSHYFARLHELFLTLPEGVASRFRNFNHFRGWCLIHEGYAHEACQLFETAQAAQIASKAILALSRQKGQPFVVTEVSGAVLRVWTPMSQARGRGMTRKRFEESKQKVLELAEFLVNGGELAA